MWTFDRSTGFVLKDGLLLDGDSYSGQWPKGFNNPDMERLRGVGPIPGGFWVISGPPFDDSEHGKYILRLEPEAKTETYGRAGFLWHGKPMVPTGIKLLLPSPFFCTGSKGCICSGPDTRRRVYQSGDTKLFVPHKENSQNV